MHRVSRRTTFVLIATLVVGVVGRCLVSTLGHNYDTISYAIVATIVEEGGNVYRDTTRYNYAPPWSYVVHRLASWALLFRDRLAAFKWLLTILLTLVDIGIAALLLDRAGPTAAILFFLNPISIFTTGYHRQFDNIPLLIGFLAVGVLDRSTTRSRTWAGAAVTGASLMVKHVLFAFPLWLAVHERQWRDRLITLLLPPAMFLLSFAPFWPRGHQGIINNVFLYRGYANAPLWNALLPAAVLHVVKPMLLFLTALIVGAFATRRRTRFEALLIYTLLLVACSPAVANQALAIVCAAMAVFPNAIFGLYVALGTLHLLVHHEGLHLVAVKQVVPSWLVDYPALMVVLAAGTLWLLCGHELQPMWQRLRGSRSARTSTTDAPQG